MIAGIPRSELLTVKLAWMRKTYAKMYQEMCDSPEYQKNKTEHERAANDLKKYIESGPSEAHARAVAHGYVWLFRRK